MTQCTLSIEQTTFPRMHGNPWVLKLSLLKYKGHMLPCKKNKSWRKANYQHFKSTFNLTRIFLLGVIGALLQGHNFAITAALVLPLLCFISIHAMVWPLDLTLGTIFDMCNWDQGPDMLKVDI